MTRIVIPVEDEHGLESLVAEHFGRAPFYAAVDLDENGEILSMMTEANKGEHHGGTGHPHENLLALKPDVIVACGMGPGGLASFQNGGIAVLKANADRVKEIVASYKQGKLEVLADGCEHAHHHTH